eukprot:TRINITY_DN12517_c0_g1_i1.p1 TRINITY_DN12517_c0_g1~~TRINITY_DN12517_c0_g1_i1.p1  ORF type:complete len:383 (-),score=-1.25 TRINITY_DN12517_c0_g1_i1:299-1357(-)
MEKCSLCRILAFLPLSTVLLWCAEAQLVPAVFIFGDSTVDVGNNNGLLTLIKSNFPPYGRDFDTKSPTGRFCDGRLATDYVCETLGFTSFPPAFLSPEASASALLTGVNFASGGSGIYDQTARLYNTIPLTQQLQNFRQHQSRLQRTAGAENASTIISEALYVVSAGASDFVQNYYISPTLKSTFTVSQFVDFLMQNLSRFLKNLYGLGARRIGLTSLPPLGCLPASITLFGHGSNRCVQRLNADSRLYNTKLNHTVNKIASALPNLKAVVFDIYSPLLDLIEHPGQSGFAEARKACCGTGVIETAILCNAASPGTCANASNYVFWDSFHPSQAANQVLANALIEQGISLIS